jgi:uncharacterized protein YggE
MKKWIAITAAILLVAIIATGCTGNFSDLLKPAETQVSSTQTVTGPAVEDERSKISVTTTESVTVVPDIAYVTLGVSTQGASADEAQKQNNTTANAVLDAIRQQGITDENIQTSNINVYPDYNDPSKYNVEVTYRIKVSPIENVGKIIDSAIAAGANVTYSLSFDIEDRDGVYMQALEKAMGSVSDKAQKMAEAGGLSIDRVLLVQESGSNYYPMYDTAMKNAVAGEGSSAVSVAPGQMEVSATVTATYLLK